MSTFSNGNTKKLLGHFKILQLQLSIITNSSAYNNCPLPKVTWKFFGGTDYYNLSTKFWVMKLYVTLQLINTVTSSLRILPFIFIVFCGPCLARVSLTAFIFGQVKLFFHLSLSVLLHSLPHDRVLLWVAWTNINEWEYTAHHIENIALVKSSIEFLVMTKT